MLSLKQALAGLRRRRAARWGSARPAPPPPPAVRTPADALPRPTEPATSRRSLEVQLRRDGREVVAVSFPPAAADAVLRAERQACLESLDRARSSRAPDGERRQAPPSPFPGSAIAGAVVGPPEARLRPAGFGEDRSAVEYEAEVERYLDAFRAALPDLVARRVVEAEAAPLRLQVVNRTDRRLSGVHVVVDLAHEAEHTRDAAAPFPDRPRPYGTSRFNRSTLALEDVGPSGVPAPAAHGGGDRRPPSSARVTWPPIDLPPGATVALDEVPVGLGPGTAPIAVAWRATSADVDGIEAGEITLPVRIVDLTADRLRALLAR
ncbi:MAG TPA: hypothetical protein VHK88_15440 [Aquihabitans sp.]|nr:hypothetical protein [Aquihabitans sp.]